MKALHYFLVSFAGNVSASAQDKKNHFETRQKYNGPVLTAG